MDSKGFPSISGRPDRLTWPWMASIGTFTILGFLGYAGSHRSGDTQGLASDLQSFGAFHNGMGCILARVNRMKMIFGQVIKI
jgi:hypothetical protein